MSLLLVAIPYASQQKKNLKEKQVIDKAFWNALWQVIVMDEILYAGVLISP